MSDMNEPAGVSKQEPSTAADLAPAQPPSRGSAVHAPQGELPDLDGTRAPLPASQAERGFEDVQLLTRLLLGGLLMGSGSIMETIRDIQHEIEAEPGLLATNSNGEDESLRDLLGYLSVGLIARGQKGAFKLVKSGFGLSLNATRRFIGGVDRATDNRLARPLRRAMISRLQRLERIAELVIDEGRLEKKNAELLAGETIDELSDQVMDTVAESPELTDMIIQVVGQQGKGMASVAGDNARSLSVIADGATERFVRRLLKRKPRQELPPSPMRGVPQNMYSAEEIEPRDDGNGQ